MLVHQTTPIPDFDLMAAWSNLYASYWYLCLPISAMITSGISCVAFYFFANDLFHKTKSVLMGRLDMLRCRDPSEFSHSFSLSLSIVHLDL